MKIFWDFGLATPSEQLESDGGGVGGAGKAERDLVNNQPLEEVDTMGVGAVFWGSGRGFFHLPPDRLSEPSGTGPLKAGTPSSSLA